MTAETRQLIDRALNAHDKALQLLRSSDGNMTSAVELTAHTAELVRDIATTMRAAHDRTSKALDTVLEANHDLLAALRADQGEG